MSTSSEAVVSLVQSIDDVQFGTQIASATSGPALVVFGAPWCNPCKQLRPNLDAVAKKYEGKLEVFYYDVDKSNSYANVYSVRGVPTMLLFVRGDLKGSMTGYQAVRKIEEFIDPLLPPVV